MKFIISRPQLAEAVKNAAKVAPPFSNMEAIKNILIECDESTSEVYLTATNNEASVKIKTSALTGSQGGAAAINGRLLDRMLPLLTGDYVVISAETSSTLTITSGNTVFKINCIPAHDYPKPEIAGAGENAAISGVCTLNRKTTRFLSESSAKPALQCVNVKMSGSKVNATASDSFKMIFIKGAGESKGSVEFLMPGRALNMLAAMSEDSDMFNVSDNGSQLIFDRGDITFAARKLTNEKYLDTASLIKNLNTAYSAITETRELKEALETASVSSRAGKNFKPVNLVVANNEITITCENDHSEARVAMPASVSSSTPPGGFWYDPSPLLQAIRLFNGKAKLEIDARGTLIIKTSNEVYFQAPFRPPIPASSEAGTTHGSAPETAKAA